MNRRSLIVPALATAAVALGATAPAGAQAATCSALAPTHVKLVAGGDTVTVKWRAPRSHPANLAYRVSRGGRVVGQTAGRKMSVRVTPGRAARITVTAVLGGRKTRCTVTRVLAAGVPGGKAGRGAPGAVKGLAARSGGARKVRLTWDRAVRGGKPLDGYRVLRDGRSFKKTRKTSLVVRVRGKKPARIQVAALDRSGRMGPRSSTVTVVARHNGPSAPSGLAASEVTATTATLSWGESSAQRGRIAGYRLLRDGRTVAGVKRTRTRLTNLKSAQSHAYRVIAVDSLGWVSDRSDAVTVTTGHDAPGAPGAPGATSVGDRTVSLAWAAGSLPAGSKLRGYRVMRDGKVVAQVAGTQANFGNLAPKSGHDWSVATVDTLGYVSAPSPASRVVQGDPEATSGAVHAFLLASTGASFAAFRDHYKQIGVVYPTFYDCNLSSGLVVGRNDQQIVTYAQDRKVKVLPRFNCQSTEILHRLFTEPALRAHWIDTVASLAVANGWDGVNIDFESGAWEDRDLMTSFIADLSHRLHAQGKLLSQAVSAKTADVLTHPRSSIFDYKALSQYDDYVFVMAWGVKWATSEAGPQDDLPWVQDVADYVATMPLKDKFVLGTMLYGMDWPAGGGQDNPGVGRHFPEIQALAARPGATNVFDPSVGSMHLHYTDDAGVPHDLWYSDAPAVGLRTALARRHGLKVGFWRAGQEDPRVWNDPNIAPGS